MNFLGERERGDRLWLECHGHARCMRIQSEKLTPRFVYFRVIDARLVGEAARIFPHTHNELSSESRVFPAHRYALTLICF